jgi:hypothetical protein
MEKKRKHLFKHRNYLNDVAENIITTMNSGAVSKEILVNTLLGVYETAFAEGYQIRIEDSVYFKDKKNTRRKASWDSVKTHIDDLVHKESPINQSIEN